MAVINEYINPERANDKKEVPAFLNGAEKIVVQAIFEVAVADDDTSVYRLARLNASMILTKIEINNDAITSGTDWDLGLYKVGAGGAVKIKDVFLNGADLSSARIIGAELDGLLALNIADLQKRLYEHAGDTLDDHDGEYDLALTANTVGAAAGTILVRAEFIQG